MADDDGHDSSPLHENTEGAENVPCEICGDLVPFATYSSHAARCIGRDDLMFISPPSPILWPPLSRGEPMHPMIHPMQPSAWHSRMLQGAAPMIYFRNLLTFRESLSPHIMNEQMAPRAHEIPPDQLRPLSPEEACALTRDDVCAICLNRLDGKDEASDVEGEKEPRRTCDGVRMKDCRHIFCSACITRWLRQTPSCPLCKTPVASLAAPVGTPSGSGAWTTRMPTPGEVFAVSFRVDPEGEDVVEYMEAEGDEEEDEEEEYFFR